MNILSIDTSASSFSLTLAKDGKNTTYVDSSDSISSETILVEINNLVTKFNFIEENGLMGNSNVFENTISYNLDENNFVSFNTRRNRKLNLTEYYDLVYEYKNDCLTAGIKYQKTYYEDRDLKPSEDLLLTITLFPLTTYEYEVEQ